ncbi:MAG TPA: hypothetical protein VFL85_01390, partial [Candidatus Saccharimonadales bacterium]|nr:hypothetical protein [Candidatus Saccharimonadales bacterium]
QSKFSWESLEAAANRLQAYEAMADRQWQAYDAGKVTASDIRKAAQDIETALENDLDTPQVLAILSGLEGAIDNGGISISSQEAFRDFLQSLDAMLGLQLANRMDITAEQKQLLAERDTARSNKDWAKSDHIRDELTAQGIGLKDTPSGAVWHRN